MEAIETLIQNFDLIAYLDDRGFHHWESGDNVSHGWTSINCVFCLDHKNHLGINLHMKGFNCHKCGEHGNIFDFLKESEGVTDNKNIIKILKEFNESPHFSPKEKQFQIKAQLPPEATKKFSTKFLQYLEKRRYDPEKVIEKYNLYATEIIGDFAYRLIVPVFQNKRLLCYVGRDITGKASVPYLNSSPENSICSPKKCLYNMDNALKSTVVIVEGIFDAWRIGDGALATFGTKYTHEQIRFLRGMKRVFILYDQDAINIGKKLAHDITAIASINHVEVLVLSEGDPDNLSDDDVHHLKKELNL